MRVFAGLDDLRSATGEAIGPSEWIAIDQAQIDTFANATGDHQWIHVDPRRAAAGPFGGTIAHGFLTLSLLPMLMQSLYRIDGVKMAVNYGLNRVRFPAPVPVGSRLRARVEVGQASEAQGGVQLVMTATVEREGSEKPVCVAETVVRCYT